MELSKAAALLLASLQFVAMPIRINAHETTPPNIEEIITKDELHNALTSNRKTLIMGYMNNCLHCKMLKKSFEQLANKYPSIEFAQANGIKLELHQKVKQLTNGTKNIPGYPTIVFIHHGEITKLLIGADTEKLQKDVATFAALKP